MRKEDIERYMSERMIRQRRSDKSVVKTLLDSAEKKATAAKMLPVEEKTAVLIFLGVYEAVRQLGNAKWWLLGYESLSHEPSMKILEESDIKEKAKLQNLDRLRRLKNDANYRGQEITAAEAKGILELWDACCQEIILGIREKNR